MKYWGYLVAKLVAAVGVLYTIERIIASQFPPLKPFSEGGPNPVMRYFKYNSILMLFWLASCGIAWLIVWDQRYRCRTCLRRLRMPILRGSWTNVLLGAPRTEYICPYGHGTLKVAELQITGHQEPDWQPHEDIWKELFSLEETKK
jgi:hypothetical protein